MNIIYDNFYEELTCAVESCAIYQKVMLLYDENVANTELFKIEQAIKGKCIFNKLNIKSLDKNMLNDGYKMLIFLCNVDSFLQSKIDTRDFINFFFCIDGNYLPYIVLARSNENYICLEHGRVDMNAITSIYFNRFYNYLNEIVYNGKTEVEFDFSSSAVTQTNTLNLLNELGNSFEFIDLKILIEENIEYKYLPILDYLLITAFVLTISACKSHTLSLVDIYKSSREDYDAIDKFYAMTKNNVLPNLIELNFNMLNLTCTKTREKIKEYLLVNIEKNILDEMIFKLKHYCKNTDGILGYFYLYNLFSF